MLFHAIVFQRWDKETALGSKKLDIGSHPIEVQVKRAVQRHLGDGADTRRERKPNAIFLPSLALVLTRANSD